MFRNILQLGFAIVLIAIAVVASTLNACAMTPSGAQSSSLDPPGGERVMTLVASGVQTYVCEFDAQHHPGWVFRSPRATLFDANGRAVLLHGAGPSWEAEDGSRIVGRVIAQLPSEAKASVPQLLLETRSTAGSGVLSSVRYVQRVNTVGGSMPAVPCSTEHEVGTSPYRAEYVFYR